jgi:hypothetical protein
MPNLDGVDELVCSLSVIAQLPFDVDGDLVCGILNMSLVVQFLDITLSLTSKLFDRLALNATLLTRSALAYRLSFVPVPTFARLSRKFVVFAS